MPAVFSVNGRCNETMSRTVSPRVGSDGRLLPFAGRPVQHGAFGDRGGVRAGHVRHRDVQPRRGVDIVSVHPCAQLVQLEPTRLLEVFTRDGLQHVPDHLGVRQVTEEGVVVIFGALADIELIRLWRREFSDFITGNEVREDSQRHRLPIHLVMASAFSLRAPGVVK
jgi:hypothetical protein